MLNQIWRGEVDGEKLHKKAVAERKWEE